MTEIRWLGWLLLLGLVLSCNGSAKISRRDKYGMMRPPPLPPTNVRIPPDSWFPQLLDHFEPTDTRTWYQRYQIREDYYKEGGPVFLRIGGEGPANAGWMVSGAWVGYAEKYNALMFQLEHRYYGESYPTSDLSVENLKYLSSEQALADLAYFIVAMNRKYNLPPGTKWVAFGGSYAGNLAAWVRFKYPHLIHASVASSAPVLAKLDFPEYMDVVKASLGTHSSQCVEAVETANKHINILLKTRSGQNIIAEEFRLCYPINPNNVYDVAMLHEDLAFNFAGAVQFNMPGRIPNIDAVCDIMVNQSMGTPIIRYAVVNRLSMIVHRERCFDYKYDNYINQMRNTTRKPLTVGGRPWIYQMCTEFGFFQSSESKKALFGEDFPLEFLIQQCRDIFGNEFTKELLQSAVDRSNAIYKGLDLKATRVVYVHGSIDPWHALGITKTRIPQSPAIYINGTSHCADEYPPADSDLPALKAAREDISSLIGMWLQEP